MLPKKSDVVCYADGRVVKAVEDTIVRDELWREHNYVCTPSSALICS